MLFFLHISSTNPKLLSLYFYPQLSVFIRTADRSGLPLFIGTPVGGNQYMHRTATDDFMAIELDEGYPKLTISLGAEPHSIINSAYVADNKWHKIYVKR